MDHSYNKDCFLPKKIKSIISNLDYYSAIINNKLGIDYLYDSLFLRNKSKPQILVRVDDFPRWDKDFHEFILFDEIAKKYKIHYLLGVTPFLARNPLDPSCKSYRKLNKNELEFLLNESRSERIKIALHGITHQTLYKDYYTEFIGLDAKVLDLKLRKALSYLKSFGLTTDIIIPPFNTFDIKNLQVFKKYFRVVCGGPETIKIFGKIPFGNLDGVTYVPSYPPYYLSKRALFPIPKKPVCLTIHWAWFNEEEISRIFKKIKRYVVKWDLNTLQTNM